jgi:hypothetical protein
MSFTHTVLRSYTDVSKVAIQFSETIVDDSEIPSFDGQIAAATSNVQIHVAFTQANLKSVVMKCDQAVTIYTNNPSGSSPQDTIPLVAGQARIWTLQTDGSGACPFSGNVTTMYVSNAGGTIANLQIRGICHQHS